MGLSITVSLIAVFMLSAGATSAGRSQPSLDPAKQMTNTNVQGSSSTCGLNLVVSGGSFSPDVCQLEIIVGGTSDQTLVLRRSSPNTNEIDSIVLFNIKEFKTGTYTFDPGKGKADFKGQLIDKGAIARALTSGVITLDPRSDDQVHVTCDVLFQNNIRVQASGRIVVKRVYPPLSQFSFEPLRDMIFLHD